MSTSVLPQSTPAAQGIAPAAISAFIDAIEAQQLELHSFILVRHGHIVAQGWWQPYRPELPHMLFSLSKSFTSTAVGLAVQEGLLTVEDRVIDFFPDDLPATVSPNLAAMRVHHLLSMTTGHAEDTTGRVLGGDNWVRAFLALPVEHEPGAPFVYNTAATYMLSAIVQTLTGQTLVDYLRPRLFDPLGIDYAVWESCPRGINTGGFGLNITTDAIARFGQLYLQRGAWQGEQLVAADWIAAATSYQTPNNGDNPDWAQGYGYQFWRCQHNAYRGDGAFGQYCVVLPEQDAVLAMTSGVGDMQAVLNQVWAHLLPAMRDEPQAKDANAQAALDAKVAQLTLPTLTGQATSPLAATVSGQPFRFRAEPEGDGPRSRHFSERPLQSVTLAFVADQLRFQLEDATGCYEIACGHGAWVTGTTTYMQPAGQQVAGCYAWTAEGTCVIKVQFIERPFSVTATCRFVDGELHYQSRLNVSFGPTEGPVLVGTSV
jgi:CubicO group peptidase (beta-lactamase class C family)